MPKISVIIPVYNASQYLERCLDSTVNQTLKNIEIICVNDCSTDSSLEILERYEKSDERVKIINHKINGGESKARNTGIENAKGEYISFLDNDDAYDRDFLEKLYNKAIETDSDIVKGMLKYYRNGQIRACENLNSEIEKGGKYFFTYHWWCAIYRKKLINANNIRLLEGYPLGGDVLFLNNAILKANKVEVVNNTFYNYFRRDDSGDSQILSNEKLLSSLKIFVMIMENLNQAKDISKEAYIKASSNWFMECFERIIRTKDSKMKKTCIEYAFKIYNMSKQKESLLESLKIKYPFYECKFRKSDKEGLLKDALTYTTFQKLQIAQLRFNVIKNQKDINK